MAQDDYYDILGVSREADAASIKSAFRKRAMQYHPDRNRDNPEAEKKFKQLGEAYEILSDEKKRAAYDRFGHAAFRNGSSSPGGNGSGGFSGNRPGGFSDIFDDLFGDFMGGRSGQGGNTAGPQRGDDLKYELDISLEEAFSGKRETINVPGFVTCDTCSGSGAKPGSKPSVCQTCHGSGRVRIQQGFFTIERTCPHCNGTGQQITDPCTTCSGQGRIRRNRRLKVNIPAGIEGGTRIRLTGEGEPGPRGGPEGDLYLFIDVRDHEIFERDGKDLFCRMPIPMTTAALGGEFETPVIDGGRVKISVPEGSQTGRRFRVRGKGMNQLDQSGRGHTLRRGDMFVEIQTEVPTNLTKEQKDILRKFCDAGGGNESCPESQGFFRNAKKFWDRVTDRT